MNDKRKVDGDSGPERGALASQEEIAANLASGARWLHFSGRLEKVFEAETGAKRAMYLAVQGFPALVLFNGFLFIDYLALPDIFGFALLLRIYGLTLASFATMLLLTRNPPAFVREGLEALLVIIGAVTVMILVMSSQSPYREAYPIGILAMMLFGTMVQRIRFWYVLPMSLIVMAIYIFTVAHSGAYHIDQLHNIAVFVATSVFSLIASYAFEKGERMTWLRSLNERMRSDRFEEISTIDPLTGLGNRRALDQAFAALRDDGLAEGGVAVAIADIDYFKNYNDAYGHVAGDDCLRRIAGILTGEARKHGDAVFRFGGEEFVILLAGIDAETATRTCERMRKAVESAAIPHVKPRRNGRLTISIGIATKLADEDFDTDAMIFQADTALYEAKSSGRNQIAPPLLRLVEPRIQAG